jgi:hypothetical protein
MAYNEFLAQRTVKGTFTYLSSQAAATTFTVSGVYIPAGAIVTGIQIVGVSAQTLTNAAGTVQLRAGSETLAAAVAISGLPANGAKASTAVSATVPTVGGELNLICQATSTSTAAGAWSVYVDYIYVA